MSEVTRVCGFCITGDHNKCRPVIRWYDKEWYCYCGCQQQKEESK